VRAVIQRKFVAMGLVSGWLALGCGSGTPDGGTGTAGTMGSGGSGNSTAGTTGRGGSAAGAGGLGGSGTTCTPLMKGSGITELTGPAIGAGVAANSTRRKTIIATDTSANPMFTIGGAWILDPTSRTNLSTSSLGTLIVAFTNRGAVPACFVMLNNLTYRDASGANINQMVAAAQTGNVATSVGGDAMQCSGLFTVVGDCVAPGDSSWAWQSIALPGVTVANTPVTAVDFAMTAMTGVADAQPDWKLVVQSYTVATIDATMPQKLTVTIANQGTKPVAPGGAVPYVLLDDQGLPLHFQTFTIPNLTIAPGQTGSAMDSNVQFDGSATRVRFVVNGYKP